MAAKPKRRPKNDNDRGQAVNVGAIHKADTVKDSHFPAPNQDPLVGWFSLGKNVKDRRPIRRNGGRR